MLYFHILRRSIDNPRNYPGQCHFAGCHAGIQAMPGCSNGARIPQNRLYAVSSVNASDCIPGKVKALESPYFAFSRSRVLPSCILQGARIPPDAIQANPCRFTLADTGKRLQALFRLAAGGSIPAGNCTCLGGLIPEKRASRKNRIVKERVRLSTNQADLLFCCRFSRLHLVTDTNEKTRQCRVKD